MEKIGAITIVEEIMKIAFIPWGGIFIGRSGHFFIGHLLIFSILIGFVTINLVNHLPI
ncbi:MAG: hypothetical protein ABIL78_06390 [candidate division WOR-3 bacterium]|jgi:hypothetical protein